ncbi:MAG: EthD family reductase [Proteobacteria bacterium]|nr:EthD family reductase [Pseudomonadota bacterium]
MVTISVLYPQTADATFDMAYYHATHMKMVHDLWGSMGLHGARVMRGVPGPDGAAPQFGVITLLEFESMAAFGKAAAAHGAAIMGDVPNFTNVTPVLQFNEAAS